MSWINRALRECKGKNRQFDKFLRHGLAEQKRRAVACTPFMNFRSDFRRGRFYE
jgi:hypothetical protein